MTAPRRLGAEDSATRAQLLDAAQQLMLEEGYAAVTSRRVAAKAGLKPQLVHYYFRTMDDLFLALVRRGAEESLERQARALASPQPLRSLWELSTDSAGSTVVMELAALANHRKAIRGEIGEHAERYRQQQSEQLVGVLESYGINLEKYPPDAVLLLINAVARILVLERALGMTTGHEEMRALVERLLDEYEGPASR